MQPCNLCDHGCKSLIISMEFGNNHRLKVCDHSCNFVTQELCDLPGHKNKKFVTFCNQTLQPFCNRLISLFLSLYLFCEQSVTKSQSFWTKLEKGSGKRAKPHGRHRVGCPKKLPLPLSVGFCNEKAELQSLATRPAKPIILCELMKVIIIRTGSLPLHHWRECLPFASQPSFHQPHKLQPF